ncbi:TPA: glycosyltransferase, partial [Candidatus Micrarchaeota archaeon]|nr:glycosyltransferase [Candidatus Micrarchaeota archaeon]
MKIYNLVVVFKGKSTREAIYYVARDISKILDIPLIILRSSKDVIVLLKRLRNTKTVLYIGALSTFTIFKIVILSILTRKKIIIYALQHGAVKVPFLITKILRLRSIIVTPSNYLKNELKKSGLFADYVIPHGIVIEDTHFLQSSLKDAHISREHGKIKVLSVYSTLFQLRKRLGLYYLMYAWSKLPAHLRKRAILVLKVPRGQSFIVNKYAKLLKLKPQKDYIVIDRYLKPSEMKELYLSADIYVHCVLADSFGLPILEALSYGVPVIALNAP